MIKEYLEFAWEYSKKILGSRILVLSLFFMGLFCVLVNKLFELQIVNGESYLNDYTQMTEKTVTTPGTRGNIYDRNGVLLAYNELAYIVTVTDTGDYPTNQQMNEMLLRLIRILDKHDVSVVGKLEIGLDDHDEFVFTSSSEAARKRFLRDYYGVRSVDLLSDKAGEKNTSSISAEDLLELRISRYGLDTMKDENGDPMVLSNWELLQIINIRYTMSFTAYMKYEPVTVSSYVDEEAVAEIMENSAYLRGVSIEETTIRRYEDSIYFASIIGYTGSMQESQLEELQKIDSEYDLTDKVGRTGIELAMETELKGSKGYKDLVVNNVGSVMEVIDETKPSTGNDIYLTIDRDLQVGIYHLIEKNLAGILVEKIVNQDIDPTIVVDTTNKLIPVKDVYYQLINNNVLSWQDMEAEDASAIEQEINGIFSTSKAYILEQMEYELLSEDATWMNHLEKDMMAYMVYVYKYLTSSDVAIIDTSKIDTSSESYQRWKDDEISLRDYLYAGIALDWIDTSKLNIETKYSSADDIYLALVEEVLTKLNHDDDFTKIIYRYLIDAGTVTGRQLCLALYAQEVFSYEENEVQLLIENGENYAYTFIVDKISKIEITPAQLALDPCTGGVVITDVNTGEVRALVTYPSYDNNKLSGVVDAEYYNMLQDDLSLPFYNNATQAKKAPGSTFKPITAIAGIEEGVVRIEEEIICTGLYDNVEPAIKCWIYPGSHGGLDVREGLENSCNCYFSEIANRLSTDTDTLVYSTTMGISKIQEYAAMFGLDRPSGIEISETMPQVTTEDPERSAMGQGTNSYSNIQLARYVVALANEGTVFDLSLLDKMTDYKGNLIQDFTPEKTGTVEIAQETWDAVHEGMRAVISDGSAKKIFADLEVDIAGKTGTAQESELRANHAFFISYAPYTNPEIGVTVNIPYGYSSSNAATVAKDVYRFYYDYTNLDYILNTGAADTVTLEIGD